MREKNLCKMDKFENIFAFDFPIAMVDQKFSN